MYRIRILINQIILENRNVPNIHAKIGALIKSIIRIGSAEEMDAAMG